MPAETVDSLVESFAQHNYILDRSLATAIFLVLKLNKPILLEGHAGLGKTEVAKVLSAYLGARLIRLQCHEGLDVNSALYEWNYQKQLLAIQLQQTSNQSIQEKEKHIFGPDFLLERPLLAAISADAAPVLLIDEIDRADEAFEAFLLELLSDFQISIPEMGTITAKHTPYVVLTSNRTRELSDALKRRCLYHWIDYPTIDKEVRIVHTRFPGINDRFAIQIVRCVQTFRTLSLAKPPGVAETLDWVQALQALSLVDLNQQTIGDTIGCVAKSVEDATKMRAQDLTAALL